MAGSIEILDVVALMESVPGAGLQRGQVGTIVEQLAPDVYEVEFTDSEGRTYALAALRVEQILVLHFQAGTID